MSSSLLELDEYDRRHLTSHLVAAERINDLHHLLRLQGTGAEGKSVNAWYHTKAEADDTRGFHADIDIAWSHADSAYAEGGPSQQGDALALACRYALITSSLNSLAENLPPNVLAALMHHGLRTPRAVLSIIEATPDPAGRSTLLRRLVPALARAGLAQQAVDIAVEIEDDRSRASALEAVVASVPSSLAGTLLPAIRALEDERARARALAAFGDAEDGPGPTLPALLDVTLRLKTEDQVAFVVRRIGEHLDAELAHRVVKRAEAMRSATAAAQIGAVIADRFPDDAQRLFDVAMRRTRGPKQRAQVFAASGRRNEAVSEAERIPDDRARLECLAGMAENLSPLQLDQVLERLKSLGAAKRAARWKVDALAAVAPHVPARSWRRFLRDVIDIEYRDERVAALVSVAPYVPDALSPKLVRAALDLPRAEQTGAVLRAVAGRLGRSEVNAVMEKARRTRRHGARGIFLAAVAAQLSDDQCAEALTFIRRIGSSTDRALAIDALAQRLSPALLGEAIASLDIDDKKDASSTLRAFARCLPSADSANTQADGVLAEGLRLALAADTARVSTGIPRRTTTSMRYTSESSESTDRFDELIDSAERQRLRDADAARLTAAAASIAEARAATVTANDFVVSSSEKTPPAILKWFQVAEQVIPGLKGLCRAYRQGEYMATWRWEDDENLLQLIDVFVQLEDFEDAVAAASAIPNGHSRASVLARLASSLPNQMSDAALSLAVSSVEAGMESGRFSFQQEHGSPGVELTGVGEICLRAQSLTSGQRSDLADLICNDRLIEHLADTKWPDLMPTALCWALAELIPHLELERAAAAQIWSLKTACAIRDEKFRADTLTRLEPVIDRSRLDDWSNGAATLSLPEHRGKLLVILARRLTEEGRLSEALTALGEGCQVATSVAGRKDRGRILAEIAALANECGEPALRVLWATEANNSSSGLLRPLSIRGRSHLLSDLEHLAPALAAVSSDVVGQTASAIRDVRIWWP